VLGVLRGAAATSGLFDRARRWQKNRKTAVAAGGVTVLAAVLAIVVVTTGQKPRPVKAAPAIAPVALAAPVPAPAPVAPVAAAPAAPATAEEAADGDDGADDAPEGDGKEAAAKRGSDATPKARTAARSAPAENKKLLTEGERLLRAERFPEAREIFEKLTRSRHDRGPALVGLAEISFQEKKYDEAVHSAELAADKGGGVKARVLLGDAHFRLAHYKEAAKAYEDALKLDPTNASARSGLALATKRM
jgi:tetratricopeptide (TPR) repeat protein